MSDFKIVTTKEERFKITVVSNDQIKIKVSQGIPGADGISNARFYIDNGAPSNGLGSDGDIYIDSDPANLYYKVSGVWVLQGSIAGADGSNGVDGKTVLNGTGAPSNGTGSNGDFYIDTAASFIYGPKASGTWPSGVSLIGPQGATGATGAQGPQGNAGATGATGASGPNLVSTSTSTNITGILKGNGSTVSQATAGTDYAAASHTHALSDLTQSGATTNQVPQWNGSAWVPATVSGGGGGEANTASNVTGGSGVGVFKQKTGVDLEFKSILAGTGMSVTGGTSDVTVATTITQYTDAMAKSAVVIDSIADADTDHAPSRNAVFDALALKVNSSALATVATSGNHTDLSNIGTNSHATIDAHLASTSNPHSTTKAQVGLGNVVDADTTTTANITDSTNKRFVSDAQLTVIGNTSGTNTGDQTAATVANTPAGNIAATNVQAAINELDSEKQSTITGAATSIVSSNLTPSRALASDASGKVAASSVTDTELGYLSGVTSSIQTQISGKQASLGFTPLDRAGSNSITGDITNSATGYLQVAVGTTGQRPGSPANGMMRYNSTTSRSEFYSSGAWRNHARLSGDVFTGAVTPSVNTLTDAATIAVDATLGNQFTCTITASRTLGNPTGATNGQLMLFAIRNDGTGGFVLSFDTKYRFGDDIGTPVISTAANKTSFIGVRYHSGDDKFDVISFVKGY